MDRKQALRWKKEGQRQYLLLIALPAPVNGFPVPAPFAMRLCSSFPPPNLWDTFGTCFG